MRLPLHLLKVFFWLMFHGDVLKKLSTPMVAKFRLESYQKIFPILLVFILRQNVTYPDFDNSLGISDQFHLLFFQQLLLTLLIIRSVVGSVVGKCDCY